ncbi:MAG: hypothetical protein OJF51_000541 [Nitrospira sp.]|nr:MAG: hypothetical protein OJF51_000541 [Nitrospira sp.]
MVDDTRVEAGYAISASSNGEGIMFVRWLAPGCWALTSDHRVFYIHRRHSRRAPPRSMRLFDCRDPWSPDKGIA